MKYNVRVSMEIHIDAETPEQAENKVIDLFDWCLCPAPLNMKTSERSNYFSRDYFKKEGGAINE